MENVEMLRPGVKAVAVLFLLAVCLPVTVLVVANFYTKGGVGHRIFMVIASVLLVTFVTLLLFMQRAHFSVVDGVLTIRSSFYEVNVPLSEVVGQTVIDLGQHPEMAPRFRTNGFSLSGYYSGWYVGSDKRRIFAAIAGPQVLSIRVKSGYDILVSLRNPERVTLLRTK